MNTEVVVLGVIALLLLYGFLFGFFSAFVGDLYRHWWRER